jgi:hypothetical protein
MKLVTICVPDVYLRALDSLVEKGKFLHRAEVGWKSVFEGSTYMILCNDFVYLCARRIVASQSEKLGNGTYFGFLLMQRLVPKHVSCVILNLYFTKIGTKVPKYQEMFLDD